LLLDEIGEMPLHLQSKLLRALEEKKVTSVGSDRPVEIDVRFIATTNKDLQAEAERGAFRRDLYYRLSVMPVLIPPLRERPEDVPVLASTSWRRRAAARVRGCGASRRRACRPSCAIRGRGNVRELENVIERAVIVSKGDVLTGVERFLSPSGAHAPVDLSLPFRDAKARVVEEFERAYVDRPARRARRQAHRRRQARGHGSQELLGQDGALRPSPRAARGRGRGEPAPGLSARRSNAGLAVARRMV
jgi:transcriptional regulator with GAF, ATPase, and Fis domain